MRWTLFAAPFKDGALEAHYLTTFLLTSRLFTVTTGILTVVWLLALSFSFSEKERALLGPLSAANFAFSLAPLIVCLACFIVSVAPMLRKRYLKGAHSAMVGAIAVSMGLGICAPNVWRGRPAAVLLEVTASGVPVMLQARGKVALLCFHLPYLAIEAVFFGVVAPLDGRVRALRRLYVAADWALVLSVTLSTLAVVAVTTTICDQIDRVQRAMFLRNWEALRDAEALHTCKERGRALAMNLLPAVYAEKVFAGTDNVVQAEVADLVGVLAIRFARPATMPPPSWWPEGPVVDGTSLESVRAVVVQLDRALQKVCGGAAEKVGVHDGVYLVATNVAVPTAGKFAGMDPGQRFVRLLRLATVAVNRIAPYAVAGLHIGRCASGVLGSGRLSFDIFGAAAVTAIGLCDTEVSPGTVICSGAAQGVIPRRAAEWSEPAAVPIRGQRAATLAVQLRRLHERRMPMREEPTLPHSVAPEPIDLDIHGDEDLAVTPVTADRDTDLTSPSSQLSVPSVTTSYRKQHHLDPEQEATKRVVRDGSAVEAHPYTLRFLDAKLEEMYREVVVGSPHSLRVGIAGVLLLLTAFVNEVTLPDGAPLSAGLAFAAALMLGAHAFVTWRKTLGIEGGFLLFKAAHLLGGVATIVCLFAPGRTALAELRLPQCFLYLAVMAAATQTHLPFTHVLIAGYGLAMFAFFFTRPESSFQLLNRSTFPIVTSTAIVFSAVIRYWHEFAIRRAFVMMAFSTQAHDELDAEVAKGIKILCSFLPSSMVRSVTSTLRHNSAATSPSTAALMALDAMSSDGSDDDDASSSLADFGPATLSRAAPDVALEDWPVLTCCLADLPAYVSELSPPSLMRLLQHFFLLAEEAAAKEQCEVVKTMGGTVMICPRLADRGRVDLSARDRREATIRAGMAISQLSAALGTHLGRIYDEERLDFQGPDPEVAVKVSVAIGPCVGGVIGFLKRSFDLLGPSPSQSLARLIDATPGQVAVTEALQNTPSTSTVPTQRKIPRS